MKAIAPNIPSLSKVCAVYVGDYYLNSAFFRRTELASVSTFCKVTKPCSYLSVRRGIFSVTDIRHRNFHIPAQCISMYCMVLSDIFKTFKELRFERGTKSLSEVRYRPNHFANLQTEL